MKKSMLFLPKKRLVEAALAIMASSILSSCAITNKRVSKPREIKNPVTLSKPDQGQNEKSDPLPCQKPECVTNPPVKPPQPIAVVQIPKNPQLIRIEELKKALTVKISEAGKAKNEFINEITAIGEQITKSGNSLSAKRIERLRRDVQRKQNYLKLVTEYKDRMEGGFDTLDEIEDDIKDRGRWRELIDKSFIAKVDEAIREISALLEDNPKQPKTEEPASKKKIKDDKRRIKP